MINCPSCERLNHGERRNCKHCGKSLIETATVKEKTEFLDKPAPAPVAASIKCPFCQNLIIPVRNSRMTTGGYVVLIGLLILCFPLFWIGFFITEQQTFCPSCRMKL